MIVKVKLFASFREATGQPERTLDVAPGTTVGELWSALIRESSRLAPLSDSAAFAVNKQYSRSETVLHEGDEVAFLPPVSGG